MKKNKKEIKNSINVADWCLLLAKSIIDKEEFPRDSIKLGEVKIQFLVKKEKKGKDFALYAIWAGSKATEPPKKLLKMSTLTEKTLKESLNGKSK